MGSCHGEWMVQNVLFLLLRPPYNVPPLQQGDDSDDNLLNTKDLIDIVEFEKAVMKSASRGLILPFAFQLGLWFALLAK